MWNKVGRAPEDVQELGPQIWQAQGLTDLGTPIGTPEFVVTEDERQDRGGAPTLGDQEHVSVLARACREAGARVRFNAFLRDVNRGVIATLHVLVNLWCRHATTKKPCIRSDEAVEFIRLARWREREATPLDQDVFITCPLS